MSATLSSSDPEADDNNAKMRSSSSAWVRLPAATWVDEVW
jgi:hypothetical protein